MMEVEDTFPVPARMADALGYQLALVPKSADLPPEAAVIAVDSEDRHLRS